jgi:hypothetical protein
MNNNKKFSSDATSMTVLEAAIDGITEAYLLEGRYDSQTKILDCQMHLQALLRQGLLVELADRKREFIAYKTTPRGLTHLMISKSLRGTVSTPMVVEA